MCPIHIRVPLFDMQSAIKLSFQTATRYIVNGPPLNGCVYMCWELSVEFVRVPYIE